MPAFIAELKKRDAIAARALEFTILTAVRTSETLNAVIQEFDLTNALWIIPSDRMKSGRPHKVPLSARTIEIVEEMKSAAVSDYLYPGQKPKRPLSNMSMTMLLRRMGYNNVTVHGFRSTFRDWAGDCTLFSREVAEAALSHSVGDIVERSYRRKDALEKRRNLMEQWAGFCAGLSSEKVIPLYG